LYILGIGIVQVGGDVSTNEGKIKWRKKKICQHENRAGPTENPPLHLLLKKERRGGYMREGSDTERSKLTRRP